MRATEFIYEGKKEVNTGLKPPADYEYAIPNAHRVAGTADRHYDLSRIMMLVAATDGKQVNGFPPESWSGRNNIATPYTPVESDMLKMVYKTLGYEWEDALSPNPTQKSQESSDTNKLSPISTYKKNKHGY